MSRFYGTVQGGRGEASRCGHATTGLRVAAGSWSGGVFVRLWVDAEGRDCAEVRIDQWRGGGPSPPVVLYRGAIDDARDEDPLVVLARGAAERRRRRRA